MRPAHRVVAFALAISTVAACSDRKGFDEMNLLVEQVGDVPASDLARVPAHDGDITTWRTDFPGQVFAAVRTKAPCPRAIHTVAGVKLRKDRIELCFTARPSAEPVPGFACSPDVYVRYEILRMPADVEGKFVFVGACG